MMKLWFKSVISILLGILILLSGSGISLAKMVCLKSGYVSISLTTPDDCCGEEGCSDETVIDEKCCDISNVSIEVLQYVGASTQTVHKSAVWISIPCFLAFLDSARNDKACLINISASDDPLADLSHPPIRIFTKTFLI